MKNVFKRIVPFLLTLLIIASIVWYGFVYDRNFTRDMLLTQARYHSTTNHPDLASWFYDTAYELSGQDESVAIELANQFKAAGNYTKAEYTLSNAIADGGNSKLYIALCKTYVEQDKLLDAVNMLDNIADPQIKAELEAMRPAAPTATPEPGFYNEYIDVSLSSDSGTLYHTTDTGYPSTEDAPYQEAFTLPGGETVVRAVSVGENGLVSPLSSFGYTVGGVIEEVTFTDPVIEASVREILGVDSDKVIFSNELWTITSFTVPDGAMNLQDLEKLPYLKSLTIQNQTFDTVSFLASLHGLEELILSDCRFSSDELELIAALPVLKKLTMSDCGLSTLAGLENAQELTDLVLTNNTIRNLEPLAPLINLKTLDLSHNALTSLNALSQLTNLEIIDVSYNVLTSIDPIGTCRKITALNASHNQITSLGTIDNLPVLSVLNLSSNALTDVEIIGNCAALTDLDVSKNSINGIYTFAALNNLEILNFSNNQVEALPEWTEDSRLRSIDGSYNQVTSVANMKVLQKLTHVFMDYNLLTSVDPLAKCYNLVQVNVYGNY